MKSMTFACSFHIERRWKGRKEVQVGPEPVVSAPAGRVPRVARLMALALRFEQLIRQKKVTDYAELATLGHVSRARISQIMNLLLLAPDIIEQLLFLPPVERGRAPVILAQLQQIAAAPDWAKQRRLWRTAQQRLSGSTPAPAETPLPSATSLSTNLALAAAGMAR